MYKPVLEYAKKLDDNTLVLFDRIETGTSTYELAKKMFDNKNVFYVDGSTPVEQREKIRA